MKKLSIILCLFVGMLSASAQTNMDYLTSASKWTHSTILKGSYSFYKFEKNNTVTWGWVYKDGGQHVSTDAFYLSDTEDTVFDNTKIGRSNTGQYIVIDSKGPLPPMVFRINRINDYSLEWHYDSHGKTLQTHQDITLYARQRVSLGVRPLFTMGRHKQFDLITSGVSYVWPWDIWKTNIPAGQLPYVTEASITLQNGRGTVDVVHYANSNVSERAKGYNMLIVRAGGLAICKTEGQFGRLDIDYSGPGERTNADMLTYHASNPYFLEMPFDNYTLLMIAERKSERFVVFAITNGSAKIVYDNTVPMKMFDCRPPTYLHLVLDDDMSIYKFLDMDMVHVND